MSSFLVVAVGLVGGFISGLFGIGGGVIFVPLLMFAFKFQTHMAIGTSLAIVVPTAFVGLMIHQHAHLVNWKIALMVALFAIVGAFLGATLSVKLDVTLLRKVFAVFLIGVAVRLFFK